VIDVVIVGSGNAALCAGIAAQDAGATTLMIDKADPAMAGGNSRYTAGAMRFAYDGADDVLALLDDPEDEQLAVTDFGSYTTDQFSIDLHGFNEGRDPIYSRQSFRRDGRNIFWGGLTLAAVGEGPGLVDAELSAYRRRGGEIRYEAAMSGLVTGPARNVRGVRLENGEVIQARAVVLGCGGFEANAEMRVAHLGPDWSRAKVRGTPHNTGIGLTVAYELGAADGPAHGGLRQP